MKILIADDNALVRRGVGSILASAEGCFVCGEAKDGTEALQKSLELMPDLILLDISMPGMSGWETARSLLEQLPNAKIIVMSQNEVSVLKRQTTDAGAHACIDKSRLAVELLPTIDALRKSLVA